MNDGARDAEEFLHVNCDCPCEGQIGTAYDTLIDMMQAVKDDAHEARIEARQKSMLAARASDVAEKAAEVIRLFMDKQYDDEGNMFSGVELLDGASAAERMEESLGALTSRLRRIADDGDAVIAAIASDEVDHSDCSPGDGCTASGHIWDKRIRQAEIHNEVQKNVEPSRRRVIDPDTLGWPVD